MNLDQDQAVGFAQEWIEAWNRRDLTSVLAHYAEDFEMSSPLIVKITGEPSGTLAGKTQVEAYWRTALTMIPGLHFELVRVFVGAGSDPTPETGHNGM